MGWRPHVPRRPPVVAEPLTHGAAAYRAVFTGHPFQLPVLVLLAAPPPEGSHTGL